MVSVLCDGGFYIEYSKHHAYLLSHLSKAEPTLAKQVKSITFAAQGLCATSDFLRTSTSHLAQFLELAERSLPVASIHQSTVFVEKLVRGLAKQIALGNVDAEQLTRMRQLLLQVLSYPDDVLRSAGWDNINCLHISNCEFIYNNSELSFALLRRVYSFIHMLLWYISWYI